MLMMINVTAMVIVVMKLMMQIKMNSDAKTCQA